ncbi:MAG TPA: hypothetical protein VJ845_02240, partial [Haploplasma sp.]|nr:hypothetical protein [Haploplasma sp.]
ALEEKKTTLLEFVEKAIFDYNFNSRKKVKLDDEVKVLLDVTAKEGEWSSYTLRELLVRAFKYVNLRPVLKNDYTITYSKTTRISRYIDFGDVNGVQAEQISDDYYDKVVSSSKNLVSQDDFITEILPLSSTSLEFSHIDEKSGGFLTSNNIYYVSNGILYTPDFELNYGEEVVKTNMGKDYYWDITSMLYESDIYSSFPNISLKGNIKNDELSTRADISLLTQANRLSYKSGSNVVTGLFNIGEQIPD